MSRDSAPSPSDLAEERFETNLPECAERGHLFATSRETGEDLGPCDRCGISVEGAELLDELRIALAGDDGRVPSEPSYENERC